MEAQWSKMREIMREQKNKLDSRMMSRLCARSSGWSESCVEMNQLWQTACYGTDFSFITQYSSFRGPFYLLYTVDIEIDGG